MLDGVNPTCAQCSKDCKQWKQVKVIICQNYKSATLQAQQNGGNGVS